MILQNSAGLSLTFSDAGALLGASAGPIALCPPASSWLARSLAGLVLRRHGPTPASAALLGPLGPSRHRVAGGCLEADGSALGLDYSCTLALSPHALAFRVQVELVNRSAEALELDALFVLHVALKTASPGPLNEHYVAQYLERRIVRDARHGAVLLCRQNMREATGHPFLMLASAGCAEAASTDGHQFYGPSFRATLAPQALSSPRLGGELAGESAVVALQEAPFVVEPGAAHTCSFVVLHAPDHPLSVGEADLVGLARVLASVPAPAPRLSAGHAARPRADAPAESARRPRFEAPRLLPCQDLTPEQLTAHFGAERRHEERDGAALLSFFCAGPRHVVLRAKELRVLRPHGHILQAAAGARPDERVMSTTAFLCGVFNSHLTQGNTNFNTLLSVCATPATPNLEGQRLFVRLADGEYLLGVPSAFEMGLAHCRWLYEHPEVAIEVCTWAAPAEPHVHLSVRVLRGGPVGLALTHQFDDLGWDVTHGDAHELVATPRAQSPLARSFPGAQFRLVVHGAPAGLTVETLRAPSGRAESATLVLEVPEAEHFCMTFVGEVPGPAATPRVTAPEAQRLGDTAARVCGLSLEGPAAAAALAETLPWYELDALIHFLTPYGLEQFSGAAWGTRDVCQGPIELLLCQGKLAEAKEVLRTLFSRQDPEGGWPQWWMFDRYVDVRADSAHGDVIYWCLLALCSYVRVSSDFDFLEEPLPFFGSAVSAPVSEHVARVLRLVEASFVPGTALVQFGGGDWNDSLQPVSEELARRMVSSWTVQMSYQAVDELRELYERAGHVGRAAALGALAGRIHGDFQRALVRDGVVAGYGLVRDDGQLEPLLHPRDATTGVRYSLLPMDRGVISGVFSEAQANQHLALIASELTGPDGARLMDRPLPYAGGLQRIFQRAESSCYFGREIGLMYVHEHLRYAEALARMGRPDEFLSALRKATPVAYRELVPAGALRQANCYYSSSDVLFPTRYDADLRYGDVLAGKLPLEGGWRVYSSGPGIFISHVVTRLLGLRVAYDHVVVDPMLARALDGLCARLRFLGRELTLRYHVAGRGFAPVKLTLNGRELPFERETQPYRSGGALVPRARLEALLHAAENVLEVEV